MAISSGLLKATEEALAFHEALRRLGFGAEDIFVQGAINGETGKPSLFVLLRVKGMPESTFACGDILESELPTFHVAWAKIVEAWNGNGMSEERRRAIYNGSFVKAHALEFIAVLVKKGHLLPKTATAKLIESSVGALA